MFVLLLMVSVIVLAGVGYYAKFGMIATLPFVFIELVLMFTLSGAVKKSNHFKWGSFGGIALILVTFVMMGLTSYGLHGYYWKTYETKFQKGNIATKSLDVDKTELNTLVKDRESYIQKIKELTDLKVSLIEKKKKLTDETMTVAKEVNDVIYSVKNCEKSVDCTTRKNMIIERLNGIKDNIEIVKSEINETSQKVNRYNTLLVKTENKIDDLKNTIKENEKIRIQNENEREILDGDVSSPLYIQILSWVVYPSYILLLLAVEMLNPSNIEIRKSKKDPKKVEVTLKNDMKKDLMKYKEKIDNDLYEKVTKIKKEASQEIQSLRDELMDKENEIIRLRTELKRQPEPEVIVKTEIQEKLVVQPLISTVLQIVLGALLAVVVIVAISI
jgi:chromosome segregation ATPase